MVLLEGGLADQPAGDHGPVVGRAWPSGHRGQSVGSRYGKPRHI